MLYIENIDDCTFKMYGNLTTETGVKILDKRNFVARGVEPQSAETQGRITIYNTTLREKILVLKPVANINLDGTVYVTAETFVAAFNALMAECCCAGTSNDDSDITTTTTEEIQREVTTTTEEIQGETTTTTTEEIPV
jgi:hypothetical protein